MMRASMTFALIGAAKAKYRRFPGGFLGLSICVLLLASAGNAFAAGRHSGSVTGVGHTARAAPQRPGFAGRRESRLVSGRRMLSRATRNPSSVRHHGELRGVNRTRRAARAPTTPAASEQARYLVA